jgi:hypothetical protein
MVCCCAREAVADKTSPSQTGPEDVSPRQTRRKVRKGNSFFTPLPPVVFGWYDTSYQSQVITSRMGSGPDYLVAGRPGCDSLREVERFHRLLKNSVLYQGTTLVGP